MPFSVAAPPTRLDPPIIGAGLVVNEDASRATVIACGTTILHVQQYRTEHQDGANPAAAAQFVLEDDDAFRLVDGAAALLQVTAMTTRRFLADGQSHWAVITGWSDGSIRVYNGDLPRMRRDAVGPSLRPSITLRDGSAKLLGITSLLVLDHNKNADSTTLIAGVHGDGSVSFCAWGVGVHGGGRWLATSVVQPATVQSPVVPAVHSLWEMTPPAGTEAAVAVWTKASGGVSMHVLQHTTAAAPQAQARTEAFGVECDTSAIDHEIVAIAQNSLHHQVWPCICTIGVLCCVTRQCEIVAWSLRHVLLAGVCLPLERGVRTWGGCDTQCHTIACGTVSTCCNAGTPRAAVAQQKQKQRAWFRAAPAGCARQLQPREGPDAMSYKATPRPRCT